MASFGIHSKPEYQLPQIPDFREPFRTVNADDANAAAIPVAEQLDLTGSRFGVGNKVLVFVKGAAQGVKISLYIKRGADFYLLDEKTTTAAKQALTFSEVPAGIIVPVISGTGNALTVISAGGTR